MLLLWRWHTTVRGVQDPLHSTADSCLRLLHAFAKPSSQPHVDTDNGSDATAAVMQALLAACKAPQLPAQRSVLQNQLLDGIKALLGADQHQLAAQMMHVLVHGTGMTMHSLMSAQGLTQLANLSVCF